MRRSLSVALVLALFAIAGCAEPVTQLIIVADSDLDFPSQYSGIKVSARGPAGTGDFVSDDLDSTEPQRVVSTSIYPLLDDYAPLELTIYAEGSGADYPPRYVETAWVPGESRVLSVFLSRACAGVTCADGQTCIDGACADDFVDPASLPLWDGEDPARR